MSHATPNSLMEKAKDYEEKADHLRRLLMVEEFISDGIGVPEPKFNFDAPDGTGQGGSATMIELGEWYKANWTRHREEFRKYVEEARIEIEGEG